jgi:hypothetical protein
MRFSSHFALEMLMDIALCRDSTACVPYRGKGLRLVQSRRLHAGKLLKILKDA